MIKLACFDLDGTLVVGTNTFQFVIERLGFNDLITKLEKWDKDYRSGLISNVQVARLTAKYFTGVSIETIREILSNAPTIANIKPTISALKEHGIIVILASIQWSFMVQPFAIKYDFDSYCGTEMRIRNNVLTGELENVCTEKDKLQFFLDTCRSYNIPEAETIAIGDSKSDHPIFREAGKSIALNADVETKKLATYSVDTDNLMDIVPFFEPAAQDRIQGGGNRE